MGAIEPRFINRANGGTTTADGRAGVTDMISSYGTIWSHSPNAAPTGQYVSRHL
jgi:hypothetical protein